MLDEAQQREFASKVRAILDLHKRKEETYLEILKMCLRHIKPVPTTRWEADLLRTQRKVLIEGLEKLIKEHDLAQEQAKQTSAATAQEA